jgi:hypothetical protein
MEAPFDSLVIEPFVCDTGFTDWFDFEQPRQHHVTRIVFDHVEPTTFDDLVVKAIALVLHLMDDGSDWRAIPWKPTLEWRELAMGLLVIDEKDLEVNDSPSSTISQELLEFFEDGGIPTEYCGCLQVNNWIPWLRNIFYGSLEGFYFTIPYQVHGSGNVLITFTNRGFIYLYAKDVKLKEEWIRVFQAYNKNGDWQTVE